MRRLSTSSSVETVRAREHDACYDCLEMLRRTILWGSMCVLVATASLAASASRASPPSSSSSRASRPTPVLRRPARFAVARQVNRLRASFRRSEPFVRARLYARAGDPVRALRVLRSAFASRTWLSEPTTFLAEGTAIVRSAGAIDANAERELTEFAIDASAGADPDDVVDALDAVAEVGRSRVVVRYARVLAAYRQLIDAERAPLISVLTYLKRVPRIVREARGIPSVRVRENAQDLARAALEVLQGNHEHVLVQHSVRRNPELSNDLRVLAGIRQ